MQTIHLSGDDAPTWHYGGYLEQQPANWHIRHSTFGYGGAFCQWDDHQAYRGCIPRRNGREFRVLLSAWNHGTSPGKGEPSAGGGWRNMPSGNLMRMGRRGRISEMRPAGCPGRFGGRPRARAIRAIASRAQPGHGVVCRGFCVGRAGARQGNARQGVLITPAVWACPPWESGGTWRANPCYFLPARCSLPCCSLLDNRSGSSGAGTNGPVWGMVGAIEVAADAGLHTRRIRLGFTAERTGSLCSTPGRCNLSVPCGVGRRARTGRLCVKR